MCTIQTLEICPLREFIFGLTYDYPNTIYSYLDIIWVAYFGKELLAKKVDGLWLFSKEEKEMHYDILSAYKKREFSEFDFVKNGDTKLLEKMNSRRKL